MNRLRGGMVACKSRERSRDASESTADVCSICLEACDAVFDRAAAAASTAAAASGEHSGEGVAAAKAKRLPCGHVFHASCWQGAETHGKHMTCPNCRARVHSSVDSLPECHGGRGQWQACAQPAMQCLSARTCRPPLPPCAPHGSLTYQSTGVSASPSGGTPLLSRTLPPLLLGQLLSSAPRRPRPVGKCRSQGRVVVGLE